MPDQNLLAVELLLQVQPCTPLVLEGDGLHRGHKTTGRRGRFGKCYRLTACLGLAATQSWRFRQEFCETHQKGIERFALLEYST